MNRNIIEHDYHLSRKDRNEKNGHNSFALWFTGLSGSGKSTIANELEKKLFLEGLQTYSLDGDSIRKGLSKNLSFNTEDRTENNRRIAEVAKLFIDAGIITITAFISPLKKDREYAKAIIGQESFFEIFVNTPLEVCEKRDVKGLYKKARAGEIDSFTGINAPYEKPENPDIEINTASQSIEEAVSLIFKIVEKKIKSNE